MEKKQTAVEWLRYKLDIHLRLYTDEWKTLETIIDEWEDLETIMEKALEMEKEQIMNAVYFGHLKGWVDGGVEDSFGEQYYKETFKKEEDET